MTSWGLELSTFRLVAYIMNRKEIEIQETKTRYEDEFN
jgi:hypothetical protein